MSTGTLGVHNTSNYKCVNTMRGPDRLCTLPKLPFRDAFSIKVRELVDEMEIFKRTVEQEKKSVNMRSLDIGKIYVYYDVHWARGTCSDRGLVIVDGIAVRGRKG